MINPYRALEHGPWHILGEIGWHKLNHVRHGDLPGWLEVIDQLPPCKPLAILDRGAPVLGQSTDNPKILQDLLFKLHPWRKGPLNLGGINIDTEWRSDWKWSRIAPLLNLQDHRILDIGCGNGYFGLRMLGVGAKSVIGVDPTLIFVMQWLAMKHFNPGLENFVLPLGIEDLPPGLNRFDSVFSMGVLYHRRDPVEHLRHLKNLTLPGGQLVLETLITRDHGDSVLVPEKRYARMRNVHAIPSLTALKNWLNQAGLPNHEVIDISDTSVDEQRSTNWMTFESLAESLDNQNPSLTVEGYPAPVRSALLIQVDE